MADLLMSTTETSAIIPEKWSANYFDVLLADLAFNSLVSRDYEGEIANLGDTVHINTIPEFDEADVLPETARSDADAVTVTSQSLVIDKRVVKDFIVTNLAKLQSLPFVDKLEQMAIYSINKKIQALIISLIVPSASAPDHQVAYASGTTLALADILEAKELKDAANVPQGSRHWVGGSAQWNDIFNITGFTSSDFVASGSPLQSGMLPQQLLGYQPHMTTVVGNTSYFFHNSFMTMAAQEGVSVKVYDLGGTGVRAGRVNVDTLIGIKQLDGKRVVSKS
jgi:hypothetical protein